LLKAIEGILLLISATTGSLKREIISLVESSGTRIFSVDTEKPENKERREDLRGQLTKSEEVLGLGQKLSQSSQ
jgi:hypothetical protein